MASTGRPGLTPDQKRDLWSRWKAGQSLGDIGRALGKHAASVFGVLPDQCSAQQIMGWLKTEHGDDETIYKSLFIQARGVLKKELLEHLRAKRTIRRSRHASLKRDGLGQITNAVSIGERPAFVEDRALPGIGGRSDFGRAQ